MNGLVAHVDTTRATVEQVMGVPTPARTNTWGVIGHGQLVSTLKEAVEKAGHKIVDEDYSLSRDGGKLFGAFTLDQASGELAWMIGFRNSVNKTLKVGITAGTRVFVCDNLAFSGDFIRFRKHTGGLNLEELRSLSEDAVEQMAGRMKGFEVWQTSLKGYPICRNDMEALTFRAIERGVIPAGKFGAFHKLFFRKENEDNQARYDNNLWGFHGAVTQLWKRNSLIGSGDRHGGLQLLLDEAKNELVRDQSIRNG